MASMNIIEQRFIHGTVPEIDLNQAQQQEAIAAAAIPYFERMVAHMENYLSILIGQNPRSLERGLLIDQEVPPEIPVELPSKLLERRPDLVQAEQLFMEYCQDKGLPGVACCVGNTYGADDVAPTPHGKMVKDAAMGKLPFYWQGGGPSVGIRDAARALLLAEEKGVVGERYIVSERWVDFKELFSLAAGRAGISPPKTKIP